MSSLSISKFGKLYVTFCFLHIHFSYFSLTRACFVFMTASTRRSVLERGLCMLMRLDVSVLLVSLAHGYWRDDMEAEVVHVIIGFEV